MADLAQLEAQKAAMLQIVADWTPTRLSFRPGPGAWSANEVFDHIVRSEVAILRAVRVGVARPHPLRLRDRLGFTMLTLLFRANTRVKAPRSASQVFPESSATLPEVCERWTATRQELAAVLHTAPPHSATQGIFRHPVSGWMTLPQVLEFFSVHMLHHGFQLARLGKASQAG